MKIVKFDSSRIYIKDNIIIYYNICVINIYK